MWNSTGKVRSVSCLFAVLATVFTAIPSLSPYTTLLSEIAATLGFAGLTNAAIQGTLVRSSSRR